MECNASTGIRLWKYTRCCIEFIYICIWSIWTPLLHSGQEAFLWSQLSMQRTWKMWWHWGKALTNCRDPKSWRQTEQQLLSVSWSELVESLNQIVGILLIRSLDIPPVLPVSKRSLLSMNGVLSKLIWLCTARCSAGLTFSQTIRPLKRLEMMSSTKRMLYFPDSLDLQISMQDSTASIEKTAPETAPTPAPRNMPLSVDMPMQAPMKIPTSEPTTFSIKEEERYRNEEIIKIERYHLFTQQLNNCDD